MTKGVKKTKGDKQITAKLGQTSAKKNVSQGRVYVTATFNNTLVTFTDKEGNTLVSGSAGAVGFKGARKATPFAATTAIESVTRRASDLGMRDVEVYIKGPGAGRDAALRVFKAQGLKIILIADVTPIPHNGPRPRKERRV